MGVKRIKENILDFSGRQKQPNSYQSVGGGYMITRELLWLF